MSKPKVLYLINPASGTQRKKNIQALVNQYFSQKFEIHIRPTDYAGHAALLAREAVAEGFDTVVAVGGDGTVNEVAQGLICSETALYIVPMGSGNGLARELRISLLPQNAIKDLDRTLIKRIDVGEINGRLFCGTAGLGFEAAVSHHFAKQKTRGLTTYAKSSIQNFLQYQPQSYEIQVNNTTRTLEAFMLTVANIAQFGNDFYIAPEADMQDGYLDLCILKPFSSFAVGKLAFQASQKTIHKSYYMETIRCREVLIRRLNPNDRLAQIDGEAVELPAEISCKILANSLKVRVLG